MTLRLRLVLALLVLVAAGLATFSVVTYGIYSHSQYQNVDNQIRNSEPLVEHRLEGESGPTSGGPGGPPVNIPAGLYAELLGPTGTRVADPLNLSNGSATPKLPSPLPAPSAKPFTVGSSSGSEHWRVLVSRAGGAGGPGGGPGGPFDGRAGTGGVPSEIGRAHV